VQGHFPGKDSLVINVKILWQASKNRTPAAETCWGSRDEKSRETVSNLIDRKVVKYYYLPESSFYTIPDLLLS